MNRYFKTTAVAFFALVAGGCASNHLPVGPSIAEVYDHVHREGARDAVAMLRSNLRNQRMLGHSTPVIPLRTPDEIVPIFVPAHQDRRTGRYVESHWNHAVIKESKWFLSR